MSLSFLGTAGCLALLAALLVLIRLGFTVVTVVGMSMTPALNPGDRVLAWRYLPRSWLRRGHVVLVKPSSYELSDELIRKQQPVLFIKRVTGLPGESLTASSYGSEQIGAASAKHILSDTSVNNAQWFIPEGHIFVQGDNPVGGLDSRTWGPIPFADIAGLVFMRLPRKSPYQSQQVLHSDHPYKVGQRSPDFVAETWEGEYVNRERYNGKALSLLFISPCEPCRNALLSYATLINSAKQANVELALVSITHKTAIEPFLQEFDFRLPTLFAPRQTNSFIEDYGGKGVPYYCLIDPEGIVRAAGYPTLEWNEWKRLVDSWT